ncbi:patatin-like phospholipase family protein [Cognatiluteimonas lumbrici]|uniref:patatin-like phospholipase family protein n=1 Tax=Cognatiluteimonas lumbrici TaxID=2559601 RepID=UPI00112A22C0|nr:patatin-like phospholipase family protein [Luteimonas lumbrici]
MSGKRVAIVIGSGAVQCASALGMWKVLDREGIDVDMVVGCSGGSIYAAVMALGYDVATCERLTAELWTPKVTLKRDWRSLLGAFMPKLFGFEGSLGMVHDAPLLEALEPPFGGKDFADARIPLHIVATDLNNGEKVVVSEGSVRDAVRASIAIPYVWKPWKIGERMLLDGCLSDPLPVDVAIREGADVILAMGFESPYPRRIKSATRYAFQVNSVYTNNLLRANYSFHNLAHHAEIIPVLPEFDRPIRLFDTDQFPYVIEQGMRATEAQLDYLHRVLEQPDA